MSCPQRRRVLQRTKFFLCACRKCCQGSDLYRSMPCPTCSPGGAMGGPAAGWGGEGDGNWAGCQAGDCGYIVRVRIAAQSVCLEPGLHGVNVSPKGCLRLFWTPCTLSPFLPVPGSLACPCPPLPLLRPRRRTRTGPGASSCCPQASGWRAERRRSGGPRTAVPLWTPADSRSQVSPEEFLLWLVE